MKRLQGNISRQKEIASNAAKFADIASEKVEEVNRRIFSIQGVYIKKYFWEKESDLVVALDEEGAYKDVNFRRYRRAEDNL